jgi:hypothetical protein
MKVDIGRHVWFVNPPNGMGVAVNYSTREE